MPVTLTPELAQRMLTIYERRLLDDPRKVYTRTLLEEALEPAPAPGFVRTEHDQLLMKTARG